VQASDPENATVAPFDGDIFAAANSARILRLFEKLAVPHRRRDRAHRAHICAGTGLTPYHVGTGTGLAPPMHAQGAACDARMRACAHARTHGAPAASRKEGALFGLRRLVHSGGVRPPTTALALRAQLALPGVPKDERIGCIQKNWMPISATGGALCASASLFAGWLARVGGGSGVRHRPGPVSHRPTGDAV
jgi:hypothetical protein